MKRGCLMRSKLVYLLLLFSGMLLFAYSTNKTYAYFTDQKSVANTLQLTKLTVSSKASTVHLQTLNETKTDTLELTSRLPLRSIIYLGAVANPWSDYIQLTLPKTLEPNSNKMTFTNTLAIKKIKEFPTNAPKTLQLTIPIFIDTQLKIKISSITLTISNTPDESGTWPSEDKFQNQNYYLTETLYYTQQHILNTPSLFVKYTGAVDDPSTASLQEIFTHKIKLGDSYLKLKDVQYFPKQGFRFLLAEPDTPTTFMLGQTYTFHFDYTEVTKIEGYKNKIDYFNIPEAIATFTLASNLSLNENNELTQNVLLTRTQGIAYQFASYTNSTTAKVASLDPQQYSWQVADTKNFAVEKTNPTNVIVRQLTSLPNQNTTLSLIRRSDNTIVFSQMIRSVSLDDAIEMQFNQSDTQEFLHQEISGQSVLSQSSYVFVAKIDYAHTTREPNAYTIPIYFKITGSGLLSQHGTFSLVDKNESLNSPHLKTLTNGNTLVFSNNPEYFKAYILVTDKAFDQYADTWAYGLRASLTDKNTLLYHTSLKLEKEKIKTAPARTLTTSETTKENVVSDSKTNETLKEDTDETTISDTTQ